MSLPQFAFFWVLEGVRGEKREVKERETHGVGRRNRCWQKKWMKKQSVVYHT